jgi:hypothetical protein
MLKPSLIRSALFLATVSMATAGCRCGGPKATIHPGQISIVYTDYTDNPMGVEKTATGMGMETALATYDFGQVPMGKKAPLKLRITNTGSGTLTLGSIEKAGGDAVAIAGMGDPMPVFLVDFQGKDLGPGEVAEYDLTFDSPTDTAATVPHSSNLILRATNTEAGLDTARITLKGISVSGECELPAVLDFGAVSRGDTFDIATAIKNTRPIDAVAFIGDITSNSGDDKAFTFTPESPKGDVSLKSGQEKTVTISFAPTEIKDYLARVTMRRLDGCPDKIVKLIGSGVDMVLTWAPNPVDFGYVTPGLVVGGDLTFSNLGLKDVTLTTLTPSTGDFKAVTPVPVTVPAATRDASATLQPAA